MIPSATIKQLISARVRGNQGAGAVPRQPATPNIEPHHPGPAAFRGGLSRDHPIPLQTDVHPDSVAGFSVRTEGPVSPVEIAWLQQLPKTPDQVSHDDALALADLDKAISPMRHPAHSRLVRAAWAPVRRMHDLNAARVALANAE